jgi:hypothetical protein
MPVTVNSVFDASASDSNDPANARPFVVFTRGNLTSDADGGKLMIVTFTPYLRAVVNLAQVTMHVHLKPYQGQSGINVREFNAAAGDVGAGVGQRAHGESVPKDSPNYPFYLKLKQEARKYMLAQIMPEVESRKLKITIPFKLKTDEQKQDHVWADLLLWSKKDGFSTGKVAYSTSAETELESGGPVAGSIEAAGAAAGIEARVPVAV